MFEIRTQFFFGLFILCRKSGTPFAYMIIGRPSKMLGKTGGNMNTGFPKLIIEERAPKSSWLVTKTREEYFQLKAFLREIATINEDRSGFNAMQPPRFVRKLE